MCAITTALLLTTTGSLLAQDHKGGQAVRPDQLQWAAAPSVLPKGAQVAVLSGDPSKTGPFTIRLKGPEGYKFPPTVTPQQSG